MNSCNQTKPVLLMLFTLLFSTGCTQTAPSVQAEKSDSEIATVDEQENEQTSTENGTGNSVAAPMAGMQKMNFPTAKDMKFKDKIETNVEAPKSVSDLSFVNKDGSSIKLTDYLGEKNVVLVFTEGFNGMLCPFCMTQTSRLVANYQEFKDRDCEVIVVYPGPEDHLDEFINAALHTEKEQVDQVPFPIVLDKEFSATDYFDIHSKHAHPSTYLIDKKGGVQFAYVGTDMTADRPSIKALLSKLDEIEK